MFLGFVRDPRRDGWNMVEDRLVLVLRFQRNVLELQQLEPLLVSKELRCLFEKELDDVLLLFVRLSSRLLGFPCSCLRMAERFHQLGFADMFRNMACFFLTIVSANESQNFLSKNRMYNDEFEYSASLYSNSTKILCRKCESMDGKCIFPSIPKIVWEIF